jgi:hypothetical protein
MEVAGIYQMIYTNRMHPLQTAKLFKNGCSRPRFVR